MTQLLITVKTAPFLNQEITIYRKKSHAVE